MKIIYLITGVWIGLGMWAVTGLTAEGHLLEAVCLFILLTLSCVCGVRFARRSLWGGGLPFFGYCLSLSLEVAAQMAGGLPPDPLWAWLNFVLVLAMGPLFVQFAATFPLPRPQLRPLVGAAYGLAVAVGIAGALGMLGPAFDPMHPLAQEARAQHFIGGGHSQYSNGVLLVAGLLHVVGFWVLWNSRQLALARDEARIARQALVIMLGAVQSWTPVVAYLPGVLPEGLEVVLHGPPAVFFTLLPIAGISALVHPDFYDSGGHFRRFLIGVALVAVCYLAYIGSVHPLTWMLNQVRPEFGRESAVFGAALVVALLVRPVHAWLAGHVDRIFYPHLLAFRTLLQETSQALATTIIPSEVAKLATLKLPERLGATGAVLLVLDELDANMVSLSGTDLAFSKAHSLYGLAFRAGGPTMLQEEHCGELALEAPALLLPLRAGRQLVGIYVLGARQPGLNYTREELEQLKVLGHHLAIAVENGRSLRKIDELSQRALAEVEERNRIAREIHDTIAQGLTAASLQLDVVGATLMTNPERAAKATDRAQSIVRANLAEARRSVLELRAPLLGTESFPSALTHLMNQAAGDIGAAGSFQLEGTYRGLPARVENQLYRIAQEALHNAVKYSSASHLTVSLRVDENQVSLSIADDGAGFDSTAGVRGTAQGGFGLTGMGERVRLVGGQLRIVSEPGEGTLVEVVIPLRNEEGESQ